MKTLLIDDERLARAELKRLLQSHKAIEIIGEAEDGDHAIEEIGRLKPELIFLDIQMPGKTGLEVLKELPAPLPKIIFTTAYDEYAVKAFEFAAIDYLLKPVEPERLQQAIEKVSAYTGTNLQTIPDIDAGEEGDDEYESHVKRHNPEKTLHESDQVFIKDGDKCYFIRLAQVRFFESIGNYVRLHSDNGKPMILRSLNSLEERLDPSVFFRASRKHIVNLRKVDSVEPYFSGGLLLKMEGGEKIEVSRRQASKFKDTLSL